MSEPTITSSLYYDRKPEAVAANSIRTSLQPSNGSTFQGNSTIRISIPCGVKGQFLSPQMSWLKLSVTPVVACEVQGSIMNMIQKLSIYHNGVLLENVENFGFLSNLLLDLTVDANQRSFDHQIMLGTNNGTTGFSMTAAKHFFNFPLLSSLFTMQDKFLPIGEMVGDLNIEATLDPAAFKWDGAASSTVYTVADVELMTEIVVLAPGVTNMIRDVTHARDKAFKIPLVQWRNYNTTIASGQSAASILVPFKVNSLKSILVGMRNQANVTSTSLSKWDRIGGATFKSYSWNVGGVVVPQKPVTEIGECYNELQKSIHDLSIGNGNSILNRDTYKGARFMTGLNCEHFAHRTDAINAGQNTYGINIHYSPEFTTPLTEVAQISFYAHYDAILTIDSTGQCMLSS